MEDQDVKIDERSISKLRRLLIGLLAVATIFLYCIQIRLCLHFFPVYIASLLFVIAGLYGTERYGFKNTAIFFSDHMDCESFF